jgi:hypothetical protein
MMATTRKQLKQQRERSRRWREHHRGRLALLRKVDALLMRTTRRADDMERLGKLIAELLDEADRRKLKRML